MLHSISSTRTSFTRVIRGVAYLKLVMNNLRVRHEYMYAMFSILLVLALSLKHELFEDVIITCNDANERY